MTPVLILNHSSVLCLLRTCSSKCKAKPSRKPQYIESLKKGPMDESVLKAFLGHRTSSIAQLLTIMVVIQQKIVWRSWYWISSLFPFSLPFYLLSHFLSLSLFLLFLYFSFCLSHTPSSGSEKKLQHLNLRSLCPSSDGSRTFTAFSCCSKWCS